MSDTEHLEANEFVPQPSIPGNPQNGAATASALADLPARPPRDPAEEYLPRPRLSNGATSVPAAPLRKALPPPPAPPRSGIERAAGIIRAALPFMQKMLPLLDGNIGTAVSNVLATQRPSAPLAPPTPPQPPVNLVPLQEGLADLRVQQRALRDQVVEQNASLKRVEDHLQAVREATDRNTLEQQELLEDLKSVGNKVNVFAYVALALLGVSVILNVVLFLQFRHIIP